MTRSSILALTAFLLLGCGTREPPRTRVEIGPIEVHANPVRVSAYCATNEETDSEPCRSADNGNICLRYMQGEDLCASGDRNVPFGTIAVLSDPVTGKERRCIVVDRMNKRYDGTGAVDIFWGNEEGCRANARKSWGVRQMRVRYKDPIRLDGPIRILARAD